MVYHGIHNGYPVYDTLEEIPGDLAKSGRKFVILYPPDEALATGSVNMKVTNSLSLVSMIFIGACLLISFVGTIYVLQQLGYLFQGRPGQKVDENMFEGGDGSMWTRDPNTGEWTMTKGPTSSMILWAVVAIAVIVVVVLVYIGMKKKEGKKE